VRISIGWAPQTAVLRRALRKLPRARWLRARMAPATEKELTMQANPTRHITADAFRKRTAVARADRRALRRMSDLIIAFTRHEGFPPHEAAVSIRLEDAR